MPITRHTGSLVAKQEDGKLVTLKIFTDDIVAELRDRAEEIPGRKTLRPSEGHVVNRLNKGRYHRCRLQTDGRSTWAMDNLPKCARHGPV